MPQSARNGIFNKKDDNRKSSSNFFDEISSEEESTLSNVFQPIENEQRIKKIFRNVAAQKPKLRKSIIQRNVCQPPSVLPNLISSTPRHSLRNNFTKSVLLSPIDGSSEHDQFHYIKTPHRAYSDDLTLRGSSVSSSRTENQLPDSDSKRETASTDKAGVDRSNGERVNRPNNSHSVFAKPLAVAKSRRGRKKKITVVSGDEQTEAPTSQDNTLRLQHTDFLDQRTVLMTCIQNVMERKSEEKQNQQANSKLHCEPNFLKTTYIEDVQLSEPLQKNGHGDWINKLISNNMCLSDSSVSSIASRISDNNKNLHISSELELCRDRAYTSPLECPTFETLYNSKDRETKEVSGPEISSKVPTIARTGKNVRNTESSAPNNTEKTVNSFMKFVSKNQSAEFEVIKDVSGKNKSNSNVQEPAGSGNHESSIQDRFRKSPKVILKRLNCESLAVNIPLKKKKYNSKSPARANNKTSDEQPTSLLEPKGRVTPKCIPTATNTSLRNIVEELQTKAQELRSRNKERARTVQNEGMSPERAKSQERLDSSRNCRNCSVASVDRAMQLQRSADESPASKPSPKNKRAQLQKRLFLTSSNSTVDVLHALANSPLLENEGGACEHNSLIDALPGEKNQEKIEDDSATGHVSINDREDPRKREKPGHGSKKAKRNRTTCSTDENANVSAKEEDKKTNTHADANLRVSARKDDARKKKPTEDDTTTGHVSINDREDPRKREKPGHGSKKAERNRTTRSTDENTNVSAKEEDKKTNTHADANLRVSARKDDARKKKPTEDDSTTGHVSINDREDPRKREKPGHGSKKTERNRTTRSTDENTNVSAKEEDKKTNTHADANLRVSARKDDARKKKPTEDAVALDSCGSIDALQDQRPTDAQDDLASPHSDVRDTEVHGQVNASERGNKKGKCVTARQLNMSAGDNKKGAGGKHCEGACVADVVEADRGSISARKSKRMKEQAQNGDMSITMSNRADAVDKKRKPKTANKKMYNDIQKNKTVNMVKAKKSREKRGTRVNRAEVDSEEQKDIEGPRRSTRVRKERQQFCLAVIYTDANNKIIFHSDSKATDKNQKESENRRKKKSDENNTTKQILSPVRTTKLRTNAKTRKALRNQFADSNLGTIEETSLEEQANDQIDRNTFPSTLDEERTDNDTSRKSQSERLPHSTEKKKTSSRRTNEKQPVNISLHDEALYEQDVNSNVVDRLSCASENANVPPPRKSVTFCSVDGVLSPKKKNRTTEVAHDEDIMNSDRELTCEKRSTSHFSVDSNTLEGLLKSKYIDFPINNVVSRFAWFSRQPKFKEMPGNDLMSVGYCIQSVDSGIQTGYLEIGPGGRKKPHVAMKYSFNFLVIEGEAHVQVHTRYNIASHGDSFIVPRGAEYCIQNLSKEISLILYFVKLKSFNS